MPEVIAVHAGVTVNTVRHSVARGGVEVFLSPQLFAIFLHISTARFGATPAQLFNAIYADDPNGGPLTGHKAVQVQRINLNRKLSPLGLCIKSAGQGFRNRAYEFDVKRPTKKGQLPNVKTKIGNCRRVKPTGQSRHSGNTTVSN